MFVNVESVASVLVNDCEDGHGENVDDQLFHMITSIEWHVHGCIPNDIRISSTGQ